MKQAADLEEKRNQIAHSVWGAGGVVDTVTRIKMTAKEKHEVRFQFEDVGEKDLADIAISIKKLAADIMLFLQYLIESGKAVYAPLQKLW